MCKCSLCGRINPLDNFARFAWKYDGKLYCSQHCVAVSAGAVPVIVDESNSIKSISCTSKPKDDLKGLAERESLR